MLNNNKPDSTVEIRPGEFETLSEKIVTERGQSAGFFHSLGRALCGVEVNNKYLKSDGKTPKS